MITVADLLKLSGAFGAASGRSEARVSTIVLADGKAIGRIRAGGDIGARRLARVWRWFDANWPDGAEWPAGIERPEGRESGGDHAPTMADASAQSTHLNLGRARHGGSRTSRGRTCAKSWMSGRSC